MQLNEQKTRQIKRSALEQKHRMRHCAVRTAQFAPYWKENLE